MAETHPSKTHNLRADGARLWATIQETAAFGGTPAGGINRLTLSPEFVETMLRDPQNIFELEPRNSMGFAAFVNRTGLIKRKPASWKDYFARAVHGLDGS